MRTLVNMAGFAALALAGTAAQATDFSPLMDVARATWPERHRMAVVADYARSRDEIQALAWAAGAGNTLYVLDTRTHSQVANAETILLNRVKPDCLVLLPKDPLVFDGSFQASVLLGHLAVRGIPTIATTPRSLSQGAVFALGPATWMELLVTDKTIGTVEVILPQRGRFLGRQASLGGMATIQVMKGL